MDQVFLVHHKAVEKVVDCRILITTFLPIFSEQRSKYGSPAFAFGQLDLLYGI
jgi:hypothetical protein